MIIIYILFVPIHFKDIQIVTTADNGLKVVEMTQILALSTMQVQIGKASINEWVNNILSYRFNCFLNLTYTLCFINVWWCIKVSKKSL